MGIGEAEGGGGGGMEIPTGWDTGEERGNMGLYCAIYC